MTAIGSTRWVDAAVYLVLAVALFGAVLHTAAPMPVRAQLSSSSTGGFGPYSNTSSSTGSNCTLTRARTGARSSSNSPPLTSHALWWASPMAVPSCTCSGCGLVNCGTGVNAALLTSADIC